MENSTVAGEHMTRETFLAALDLTARLEETAWAIGAPRRILISGGEATEHPEVLWFLETTFARGFEVVLITNGMWLDDGELRAQILRSEWRHLRVQVTNDPRFYPRAPCSRSDDPRVVFVPSLTLLVPLGRMKPARAKAGTDGLPTRMAPTSFNLRSLTRAMGDVRLALAHLRARAALGMSGNCSPSVSADGQLMAGETNSCFPIGDVNSTAPEVTRALVAMQCNKCGLVDNLSHEQQLAIGEARTVLL